MGVGCGRRLGDGRTAGSLRPCVTWGEWLAWLLIDVWHERDVKDWPGTRAGPPHAAHPAVREHRPARPHRQGQPLPACRARPERHGRRKDDTRLGEQYRRIARRRGKQKAVVAVSRVICEISAVLIADPAARFTDPAADYYSRANPARQTRSKIREIERLNPGMKVTLNTAEPASAAA